jgi:hypothetical protein
MQRVYEWGRRIGVIFLLLVMSAFVYFYLWKGYIVPVRAYTGTTLGAFHTLGFVVPLLMTAVFSAVAFVGYRSRSIFFFICATLLSLILSDALLDAHLKAFLNLQKIAEGICYPLRVADYGLDGRLNLLVSCKDPSSDYATVGYTTQADVIDVLVRHVPGTLRCKVFASGNAQCVLQ